MNKIIKNKILDLIKKQETPFYLFDLSQVKENYYFFRQSLPEAEFYYSLKANSEEIILDKLNQLDSGFEIASKQELEKLLNLGIEPDKIIFGNPIKKISDLEFAAKQGLKYFVFDNIDEYYKIKKIVSEPFFVLRVEAVKSKSHHHNKEFGADLKTIKKMCDSINDFKDEIKGLTFYGWVDNSLKRCFELKELYFNNLELINIGGGFEPIDKEIDFNYLNNLNNILKDLKASCDIKFYVEPGLYVVKNSGYLITKVLASGYKDKESHIYLDAGKPSGMIGNDFNFEVLNKYSELEKFKKNNFYGPTCDHIKLFSKEDCIMPSLNDILCFYNMGAYSVCYANNFHSLPKPQIFFIDKI